MHCHRLVIPSRPMAKGMATQHKPQLTSNQTNGSESGPLTRGQFDRLAAVAFRRLWMTAIAADEEEIREACTDLAADISYDEELANVQSVRNVLKPDTDP